jgi:hypothetical protein
MVRLVGRAACRVVKASSLSSRALTSVKWLELGEPCQAHWGRATGAQATSPPHQTLSRSGS